MNAPKVVVKRGEAVDEYPLPLPMLPTYREMALIQRVTDLTFGEIISGAGGDNPVADYAVALYAIKREKPLFDAEDAGELLDLPYGAIEIHFGPAEEPDPDPLSRSGSDASESAPPAETPNGSESSTSGTSEEPGDPQ